MQQGKYFIKTCEGAKEQSTYDEVFYIIEGRKEFIAKTSEYIYPTNREAETGKIIEEHRILDQT